MGPSSGMPRYCAMLTRPTSKAEASRAKIITVGTTKTVIRSPTMLIVCPVQKRPNGRPKERMGAMGRGRVTFTTRPGPGSRRSCRSGCW